MQICPDPHRCGALGDLPALSRWPRQDAIALHGGVDCDDSDAQVNPGASEIPHDGIDQDCSGADAGIDSDGDGVEDEVEVLTAPIPDMDTDE